MKMTSNYFETSDMALCVTLCCLGFKLDWVDKTNPSRAVFMLLSDAGLGEVVQRYWSHDLLVDPLAFSAAQKEVKSRLYQ